MVYGHSLKPPGTPCPKRRYIDKNYGGVFIIWDRMFGTSERDRENSCIYGIRAPLASWNPIWANLHIFINMALDAWRTANWLDKFRVLWSRTGWRPADVEVWYPAQKSNLDQFEKYNPDLNPLTNSGIVAQYILLSVFHLWSAGQVAQLSYVLSLGYRGNTELIHWW